MLMAAHAGNARGWIDFGDLGQLIAAVIATAACAGRARRVGSAASPRPALAAEAVASNAADVSKLGGSRRT